jgi:undecaprenyl-diphosphatase
MSVIEASLRGKGWTAFFSRHVTTREVVLMQRLFDLRRFTPLTALFLLASRLGDGPLWWVTGVVLLAVGSGPTRWAVLGASLAVALSVALFTAVKNLIGRPRPYETWCDLPCLLAPPDRFSFPSGHTMTAFAVCANYAVLVPGSELFFFPVALLIGLSRVFLGCHYPTDVLAGAALGSGIGLGTARLLAGLVGL